MPRKKAKRSFKNCRSKTKRVHKNTLKAFERIPTSSFNFKSANNWFQAAIVAEPFIRDAKCQASKETDLENGSQVLQSNSDFGMEDFNKQIQEAEIQVDKLSGLLINLKTLLKDANEESKSATKTSEIKAIKKRMEKYIDDVGKIARNVRGKLQVITIDNLLHRQMPGCQKGTATDRARMNMTNVLTKKLKGLIIEFETLRQTIRDEYHEVVEQRVITVTGTRPDEAMIDHLIETGNSEQIFQTTFEQIGQGKVVSKMEEIQDRHDAVKEFEKRLMELYRVMNAVDRFRSRIDAIQTAKSIQKKSRLYMMISIILLLVAVVIITVLSV